MKVLVIGATGYIGSHAVRRLIEAGHEVTGVYRTPEGRARIASLGAQAEHAELEELETVIPLLHATDATIYAAQLLLEPEHQAVSAMLDALASSGKTFIFTSGTGVLSQKTDGEWSEDTFAEDDSFVPSKWLSRRVETENLVRAAAAQGVRSLVVRPPMIWGDGACGLIKAFYDSAERTGEVCYLGRGLNLYSSVHVDDLAELYVRALEHGQPGALYHAVSGEVAHRTLAQEVARVLGRSSRSVGFEEGDQIWGRFMTLIVMSTCSRSRSPRARRELGWTPTRLDMIAEVADPRYRSAED